MALETGAVPEAADYKVQADGSVVYTGDPEKYSRDMAAAVAQGVELGSLPAPTGKVTEEKASRRRANPDTLEKGSGA